MSSLFALTTTSLLRGRKAAELRARVCNREEGGVCCQDHQEDYQDQIDFLSWDYQVEEQEESARLVLPEASNCPR